MYLASGVARVPEMRKMGIPVALATDGPGSNNAQDMLGTLKYTACLHKVHNLDPQILYPRDVLEMAEQLAGQIHSRVFDTKIRSGVAVAEAPAHGESIFSYNPRSSAVKDYQAFLEEIAPEIHL